MWMTFAGAAGGAAAGLTGLTFIVVAVRYDTLAVSEEHRSRAAQTISLYLTVAVVAILITVPQPIQALGVEMIGIAALSGLLLRSLDSTARRQQTRPVNPALVVGLFVFVATILASGYIDHQASVSEMLSFFPGMEQGELPDGEAWAIERVHLTTHNGTHLDAPYHYASTMNGGERALTIDEIPLEWCLQPAVKLDFRHFDDGYVVTAEDVDTELARIGHTLVPLEIVVINTRAGERYGHADYVSSGCGMGRDATLRLLEQGIRLTGTDAWSWDAPFVYTKQRYQQTGDASIIWEGHKAGRDIGYCHLEKLHNLEELPADGFSIACFPVKIRGASAGWTRAVAIFDDEEGSAQ